MYGQKVGLEAAVAAAARVDAILLAQGKLNKNVPEGLSKSDVVKLIQAEFSINHVSQAKRNLLCRGSTQEIIKDYSGACVSTKGRYLTEAELKGVDPNAKRVKSFGLYLFIQGPTKRSIDLAVHKIKEMIAAAAPQPADSGHLRPGMQPGHQQLQSPQQQLQPPQQQLQPPQQQLQPPQQQLQPAQQPLQPVHQPLQPGLQPLQPGQQQLQPGHQPQQQQQALAVPGPQQQAPPSLMAIAMQGPPPSKMMQKIPVGMENVLPGFNLPMKLIGQGGSNLNYIKNETGVMVTLRGIGSAFLEPGTQQEAPEPLHFLLVTSKPEVLGTARDLALNLITTVQQEYVQYQMQQPPPQNPGPIQPVAVDPHIVVHSQGAPVAEPQHHHLMAQQQMPGVMATVVQTGYIQQSAVTSLPAPPPMVGVPPPPHFSQPPPAQVALPPPGVHIPQQPGPLVPPPTQHLQFQQQPAAEQQAVLQSQMQSQLQSQMQPQMQPQLQHFAATNGQHAQPQYVLAQNGHAVQGMVTAPGLVVVNQQPQPVYTQQHVFLSQPPPIAQPQPMQMQGQQLAFQQAPGVPGVPGVQPLHTVTPVSYQLQYVQQNPPPVVTYSAIPSQLQQQPAPFQMQQQPPQAVPGQPPPSPPRAQNPPFGPGHLRPEPSYEPYPQQYQQHVVGVVKVAPSPVPGYPPVQFVHAPEPHAEQKPKRKFTEEAPPHAIQDPAHAQQMPSQLVPPQAMLQMTGQPPPQPVPPPVQPSPVPPPPPRQGVGVPELMNINQQQPRGTVVQGSEKEPQQKGGPDGNAGVQPPPAAPGNVSYPGQDAGPPQADQTKSTSRPWYEESQMNRDLAQRERRRDDRDDRAMGFTRRERRERPTYNHYSSKPQMYDTLVQYPITRGLAMCPPPPPPPPPLMPQQQPPNMYFPNSRPY